MGTIRDAQLDLLTNSGQEFIQFKRYDKDGVYLETLVEDVLLSAPDEVIPIGNDMTVEYLPPIKKAEYITKIDAFEDVHPNSHFMYSTSTASYRWDVGTCNFVSPSSGSNPKTFPLSKNVYLDTTTTNASRTTSVGLIGTTLQATTLNQSEIEALPQVNQKMPVKLEFEYFADTDSDDVEIEFRFELTYRFFYSGTGYDVEYNAQSNEFVENTYVNNSYPERNYTSVQTNNQWQKFTINVPPYKAGEVDATTVGQYTEKLYVDFRLGQPIVTGTTADFNRLYIDNLKISEAVQTRPTAIMENKSRTTSVISNFYQSKDNILSNALKNSKHDGRILGDFVTRISPNAVKPIDQLITQEMINDYREYVKRFEGTFFNTNPEPIPISLHNKLWMNFQTNQEPVSSIIDSMSYSLKKNEYKIVCHIPNQDDDVSADFQIKYE
jgi:hypothetical protein